MKEEDYRIDMKGTIPTRMSNFRIYVHGNCFVYNKSIDISPFVSYR